MLDRALHKLPSGFPSVVWAWGQYRNEEFAQSEDFLEVVGLKARGFSAAGKLDGSNFMLVCAVPPAV